ncbi:hypothetical protein PybrP1_009929 [[Pythium] brassicae (nom. inval.)]|nr:hypothetical protein PybrP1_009929 [[Pythium] brassicae (nom. inval.)]
MVVPTENTSPLAASRAERLARAAAPATAKYLSLLWQTNLQANLQANLDFSQDHQGNSYLFTNIEESKVNFHILARNIQNRQELWK